MSSFSGAHDFVVVRPSKRLLTYVPILEPTYSSLSKLLKASIPGTSHDSSDRYPPPLCHPGTRRDYIEKLIKWGLSVENHSESITWLKGPAGVGKSAIAQSCAEALKEKLGASFFFSRPNHRDDPDRFFTSIAYQLAVKHVSYGAHLDREFRRDLTLVKKSPLKQFHELFVAPFRQPAIKQEIGERVILIGGLDECASVEAQVDIIKQLRNLVKRGLHHSFGFF